MKTFNLREALEGKPICNYDGTIVTNFRKRVCNNPEYCKYYPYIAEVSNGINSFTSKSYTSEGINNIGNFPSRDDLFMVDDADENQVESLKEEIVNLKDQIADLRSQLSEMNEQLQAYSIM